MDIALAPTVVVSRDGSRAVEVFRCDGIEKISNRVAVGAYFTCRSAPLAPDARAVVMFGRITTLDQHGLDIRSSGILEADTIQLSLAAIGEHLDAGEPLPPTPSGTPAMPVNCFSGQFEAWRDRAVATVDDIEEYLRARLYASWEFGRESVVFGAHDFLRLHADFRDLAKVAQLRNGAEWSLDRMGGGQLWLRANSQWLREMRDGRLPSATAPGNVKSGAQRAFVDPSRIAELRELTTATFDPRKLVRVCEELNGCFAAGYFLAVAMLTRAVLDHVPPIFGVRNFSEVANNYAGAKSFKDSMAHLDRSARKIADAHLHTQIRAQETLPNEVQVDCARDLDVLLGEIVRLLRTDPATMPPITR